MRAYEAVIRSQDLFYNMLLPQASLSSQEVDFGPVQFEDIRTQTIRLTNTGHSGLEFAFTQEGPAAFPPWLHVAPLNHRVEKGALISLSHALPLLLLVGVLFVISMLLPSLRIFLEGPQKRSVVLEFQRFCCVVNVYCNALHPLLSYLDGLASFSANHSPSEMESKTEHKRA